MQDLPDTFQGLIARWPSMGAFGRDIAGDKERGRIFHRRNRVPPRHWPAIVAQAPLHGLVGVDLPYLARLYEAGLGQGR